MITKPFIKSKDVLLVSQSLAVGGCWSPAGTYDPTFLEECIDYINTKNYKNILDIGANTGQFALFPLLNEELNIFSFEPQREIYEILVENVNLNSIKNTKCYNIGLSDTIGEFTLSKPVLGESGLATLGSTPIRFSEKIEEQVSITTLDAFVVENNIDKIDLIKIDTEGHEYFVLKGGLETLDKMKPDIICEINDSNMRQCGTTISDFGNFINSIGYSIVRQLSFEDYLCVYTN